MAYASWVSSSGLKATGDFLILMSKDGFKSDCAERERVPNNHFLKSIWQSNSVEVHLRILCSYFQSNDEVSASPYAVQSN